MRLETETLDRLFLEIGQFTKAKLNRELDLENQVAVLRQALLPFAAAASRPGRLTMPDGTDLDGDVVLGLGVKAEAWRTAMELTGA
jgi:hypothetical protein